MPAHNRMKTVNGHLPPDCRRIAFALPPGCHWTRVESGKKWTPATALPSSCHRIATGLPQDATPKSKRTTYLKDRYDSTNKDKP
jgi:hypothetical protein